MFGYIIIYMPKDIKEGLCCEILGNLCFSFRKMSRNWPDWTGEYLEQTL